MKKKAVIGAALAAAIALPALAAWDHGHDGPSAIFAWGLWAGHHFAHRHHVRTESLARSDSRDDDGDEVATPHSTVPPVVLAYVRTAPAAPASSASSPSLPAPVQSDTSPSVASPAVPPSASSTAPSPDASPVSPPPPGAGTLLWQIGDPWVAANSGQCGSPTFPTSTSANFVLTRAAGCMRNQLNPLTSNGGSFTLADGATYTFSFQTVTHMGLDGPLTERLVWQVHEMVSAASPITTLKVTNGVGCAAGVQMWHVTSGGGASVCVPYTEGATDTWQITVAISNGNAGAMQLRRNGSLVAGYLGIPTYGVSQGPPWFNFGPYDWDWVHNNAPSALSSVAINFNYFQLFRN